MGKNDFRGAIAVRRKAMGFYSELQMELDDYEARRGVKVSSQAVEFVQRRYMQSEE